MSRCVGLIVRPDLVVVGTNGAASGFKSEQTQGFGALGGGCTGILSVGAGLRQSTEMLSNIVPRSTV